MWMLISCTDLNFVCIPGPLVWGLLSDFFFSLALEVQFPLSSTLSCPFSHVVFFVCFICSFFSVLSNCNGSSAVSLGSQSLVFFYQGIKPFFSLWATSSRQSFSCSYHGSYFLIRSTISLPLFLLRCT